MKDSGSKEKVVVECVALLVKFPHCFRVGVKDQLARSPSFVVSFQAVRQLTLIR